MIPNPRPIRFLCLLLCVELACGTGWSALTVRPLAEECSWHLKDHRGSVLAAVGENGKGAGGNSGGFLGGLEVVERSEKTDLLEPISFLPYGEMRTSPEKKAIEGFTGQRRDDKTGLDNFNARVYDSSFCRFLQPDPKIDPNNINAYGYCAGNPVTFIDPGGQRIGIVNSPPDGGFLSRVLGSFTRHSILLQNIHNSANDDIWVFESSRPNGAIDAAEAKGFMQREAARYYRSTLTAADSSDDPAIMTTGLTMGTVSFIGGTGERLSEGAEEIVFPGKCDAVVWLKYEVISKRDGDAVHTFCHELMHAVDVVLGKISNINLIRAKRISLRLEKEINVDLRVQQLINRIPADELPLGTHAYVNGYMDRNIKNMKKDYGDFEFKGYRGSDFYKMHYNEYEQFLEK